MKNKLICSLTFLAALAACGGDEKRTAAEQAQFETVQEGSAPGVTSTIHGPGETIPPVTGTNVDTTTAFALNPNAVPGTQPTGGTLAGTFPDPTVGTTPMTGTYRAPVTRSTPIRSTPAPVRNEPAQQSPPPTETAETNTGTAAPTTTTATTTSTQPPPTQTTTTPPPQQQPKKETEEPEEEEESEQTDTAPPPPPPAA